MFSFWRRLVGKAPNAPTDAGQDERRLWIRYPADVSVTVQSASGPLVGRLSAKVRDISQGGVNLLVERPFESGQLLSMELPRTGGETHTVLACVVRTVPEGAGTWRLGCVFSRDLTDEDLEGFGARRVRHSPSDNRIWMRFPTNLSARFQRIGDPEAANHAAKVMNISASGVGLLVGVNVEAGALLSVDLLGKDGNVARTILACVVHVNAQASTEWALGCNFIRELGEGDLQSLL